MSRPPTIYILCQTRREAFQYLASNGRTGDGGDTLEPVWIGSAVMLRGRDILDCDKVVRLPSHYTNPQVIDIETAIQKADRRTSAPPVRTFQAWVNGKRRDVLTWDVQGSSEFPADADDVPAGVPVYARMIVTLVIDEDNVECYMVETLHFKTDVLFLENAHRVEVK